MSAAMRGKRGSRETLWPLLWVVLGTAAGCDQAMRHQPSYRPLQPSTFFADGQSARPLIEGTVPREANGSTALLTGTDGHGHHVNEFPLPVTLELLQRGRNRYDIFCAVCHDALGTGQGAIVQRGYAPPPSFHSARLRQLPHGHYFSVVTQGFGSMPSYADQLSPRDRWAVIAYIRALQRSQRTRLDELTPQEQQTHFAPEANP